MTCSLIVPVYNGANFLADCLDGAYGSSSPPDEVIVVDDGSTDRTAQVVAQFPQARYLYQARSGASAARNHGISQAVGAWLAFLDADDLMTADRLRFQCDFLRAHTQADGVFGEVEQFSDPPHAYPCDPRRQAARLVGTLLVRRGVFQRVGGFNVDLRAGEFIDWFLRAEELGANFGEIPELVLRRRIHGANSGRVQRDARQDYARVVMSALRRRRAGTELSREL